MYHCYEFTTYTDLNINQQLSHQQCAGIFSEGHQHAQSSMRFDTPMAVFLTGRSYETLTLHLSHVKDFYTNYFSNLHRLP